MKVFVKLLLLFVFTSFAPIANIFPKIFIDNEISTSDKKSRLLISEFKNAQKKFFETSTARPYDVLKYDLSLDWYNLMKSTGTEGIDRQWSANLTITAVIKEDNLEYLEFDCVDLQILSVSVDGFELKGAPQEENGILKIPIPAKKIGDTINISIYYRYVREENLGFFLYPKGLFVGMGPTGDSVFVEERLAYTITEPEDARYWLICNDTPSDKAQFFLKAKVPSPYTVASNGLLTKVEVDDTSRTYFWQDTTPIATYLISVASSIYKEFSEWYHPKDKNDSIEIKYFVWEKDYDSPITDGSVYNARYAFRRTTEMMRAFSDIYIEYPFCKYGIVAVQPFNFGGMEHQTITMVTRRWLRGFDEIGLAHELSHHWLGDLITCNSWADVWINEGGATFSEALWQEYNSGIDAYKYRIRNFRSQVLNNGGLNLPPVYNLPTNTIFNTNYVVAYYKASWIYIMLRSMLGDELFFTTLRDLMRDYAYKSVSSEMFKNYFKQKIPNPIIPFDIFFDQWLYKAGHPVYQVSTTSTINSQNKYDITVNLAQIQTGDQVPEVFVVPVILYFYNNKNLVLTDTVINNQRQQKFYYELDVSIDSVALDQYNILRQVNSYTTEVAITDKEIEDDIINVYPNPINTNILKFELNNKINGFIQIELYNFLGAKVKQLYNNYLTQGNYKFEFLIDDLTNGTYFVVINSDKVNYVKPIIINK